MSNPTTDIVSLTEQLETLSSQMTVIISDYYKELLDKGIPKDLAYDLVRDFHDKFWRGIISGGGNPK